MFIYSAATYRTYDCLKAAHPAARMAATLVHTPNIDDISHTSASKKQSPTVYFTQYLRRPFLPNTASNPGQGDIGVTSLWLWLSLNGFGFGFGFGFGARFGSRLFLSLELSLSLGT
jgi:hypothetical protein